MTINTAVPWYYSIFSSTEYHIFAVTIQHEQQRQQESKKKSLLWCVSDENLARGRFFSLLTLLGPPSSFGDKIPEVWALRALNALHETAVVKGQVHRGSVSSLTGSFCALLLTCTYFQPHLFLCSTLCPRGRFTADCNVGPCSTPGTVVEHHICFGCIREMFRAGIWADKQKRHYTINNASSEGRPSGGCGELALLCSLFLAYSVPRLLFFSGIYFGRVPVTYLGIIPLFLCAQKTWSTPQVVRTNFRGDCSGSVMRCNNTTSGFYESCGYHATKLFGQTTSAPDFTYIHTAVVHKVILAFSCLAGLLWTPTCFVQVWPWLECHFYMHSRVQTGNLP